MKAHEEKQRAFDKIEELISGQPDGISVVQIRYVVPKHHVISDLAIRRRIELLVSLGRIEVSEGVALWVR